MSKRLLGFDPASGLAQWWLEDGEGNWAQMSFQIATPILDLNREAQNHCDPWNAARDVRMVARIPLIVIAKWRNELGVDYWNPDHQAKIEALLDDPDWRWLRTDGRSFRVAGSARRQSRSWDASTPRKSATEWRAPSKDALGQSSAHVIAGSARLQSRSSGVDTSKEGAPLTAEVTPPRWRAPSKDALGQSSAHVIAGSAALQCRSCDIEAGKEEASEAEVTPLRSLASNEVP